VIPAAAVVDAVRPDTALVALMLVNNELGTLQPVAEVTRALRAAGKRGPHVHCDAVQAAGFVPLDPAALGVDSLALSAHKLHGPRGAGALWLRPGAKVAPLWDGGRQEKGLRSGTENLAALAGFAAAARHALAVDDRARVAGLRAALEAAIAAAVPEARPTIPTATPRAPHIASVLLPELPAEPLLHALESRGVFASAGSACASRNRAQSHVLRALGVPENAAVLRFSFSRLSRDDEPAAAAAALRAAVDEVAPFATPLRRSRAR
jgi:cysteine desulfurase